MNKEEIISEYKESNSIRAVSRLFEISEQKVRKILIDADIYKTPLSIKIKKLHQEGRSIAEIGEILKVSTKTIHAYLPYSKVVYKIDDLSDNAKRIKKHREKSFNFILTTWNELRLENM